ncbi:MAG: hypothetical protein V1668_04935 [Patescibacteria group bacterium]
MKKLTQDMHPDSMFFKDVKWKCPCCGEEFIGRFLFGNPFGICDECDRKIVNSDPEIKAARMSTKAKIAASHGFSNDLLNRVHSYQGRPGWWKSSLPKR